MSKKYEQGMFEASSATIKSWTENKLQDNRRSAEEAYERLLEEYRAYVGDSTASLPAEVVRQIEIFYSKD